MGCSHSELIPGTKNAVSPRQYYGGDNSSALTQEQLEKVQVVWALIGDPEEFFTLVMIRFQLLEIQVCVCVFFLTLSISGCLSGTQVSEKNGYSPKIY